MGADAAEPNYPAFSALLSSLFQFSHFLRLCVAVCVWKLCRAAARECAGCAERFRRERGMACPTPSRHLALPDVRCSERYMSEVACGNHTFLFSRRDQKGDHKSYETLVRVRREHCTGSGMARWHSARHIQQQRSRSRRASSCRTTPRSCV